MADEDFRQRTQRYAAEYRDYWNEHAGMAMALGFVPVVSTVMGIADAVAAHNDERASLLEKSLSTAGILPFGKAATLLGKAGMSGGALLSVVGPVTLGKAAEKGEMGRFLKPHYDPDFGTEVAELRNYPVPNQGLIDVTARTGQSRTVPLKTAGRGDDVMSELWEQDVGELPVTFKSRDVDKHGRATPYDAGNGAFTWGSHAKSAGGKMDLGTGTSGMAAPDAATYEQIRRTLAHESNHRYAGLEIDAGIWPKNAQGANSNASGYMGYFHNLGEMDSYATELRMGWGDEMREAIPVWHTRRAIAKKVEENVKAGRQPNYMINGLRDPEKAAQYTKKFMEQGLDPKIMSAVEKGKPNWAKNRTKVAGAWAESMSFNEAALLDPKLGQKMGDLASDGSWSARYTGTKTNHAKALALGEEVEPLRAKVRWNDTTQQLEVEEMDGLRRALAARNMFGVNDTNLIPIIFEPVDDVSRFMAKDKQVRRGLMPSDELFRADDATFGKHRNKAFQVEF
jgi:hypothetical protein